MGFLHSPHPLSTHYRTPPLGPKVNDARPSESVGGCLCSDRVIHRHCASENNMACAAALRGGFTHPISEHQMGELACCAVSRRRKPESSVPPFPPTLADGRRLSPPPPPPLSSIHFACPDVEALERSDHIHSLPTDPRVTSFRLRERVGGGVRPEALTRALTR